VDDDRVVVTTFRRMEVLLVVQAKTGAVVVVVNKKTRSNRVTKCCWNDTDCFFMVLLFFGCLFRFLCSKLKGNLYYFIL
jgi:hypothetical protein